MEVEGGLATQVFALDLNLHLGGFAAPEAQAALPELDLDRVPERGYLDDSEFSAFTEAHFLQPPSALVLVGVADDASRLAGFQVGKTAGEVALGHPGAHVHKGTLK